MSTEAQGLSLQRAVFLRGVSDPTEASRITTVFYRPKHLDLRYEAGFVRAGTVSVPLSNVVEMISLIGNTIERKPIEQPVEIDEIPVEAAPETVNEEAKPFRRRGRPRKDAS